MTREQFLTEIASLLMADRTIQPGDRFDSFSGWDSMGQLLVFGFLDEKMGVQLPPGVLQKCIVVEDLLQHVAHKLS